MSNPLTLQEIMEGNLTDIQIDIVLSQARFKVLLFGRQASKSTTLRILAYKALMEGSKREVLYVLKTYQQAKELGWRFLIEGNDPLIPKHLVKTMNKSELTCELINGSRIRFVGSENIDSLVGLTIDYLIMDEVQSQKNTVWPYLQPMLAARNGKAVFAGTSRGFDHFYDLYWKGCLENPDRIAGWRSWRVKTEDSGTPAGQPEQLEAAKSSMSRQMFAQEYECSPYALSGQIFDDFNIQLNQSNRELDPNKPVLISQDFNVNPGVAIVNQVFITEEFHPNGRLKYRKEELHALDEIVLENSNTFKMAQAIQSRYEDKWKGRIIIYPDASGSARKTSSNTSDHKILKDHGFNIQTRKSNPAVTDRLNAANALIQNANGERRYFIHPRCQKLIRAFIGITYNSEGKMDKTTGLDHYIDAATYIIHYLYPIKRVNITQQSLNPD